MQNPEFNQFRAIVESMADGLWVSDGAHRITYANPAMASIAGISRNDIIGKNVLTDFSEETLSDFREFYLAAIHSRTATHYECRVVTPAGRESWQGGWLTPQLNDGQFSGMVCTVQDLSADNQSKTLLQASEARFRQLLDSIPHVAVQGYGPDGTTCYWNQASEKLYGYTAKETMGMNLLELIVPEETRQLAAKLIRQMVETGISIPAGEHSLMRKDGSRVNVFSSHCCVRVPGKTPELFCIDIDLSEQRNVERALRQRESYQRALLDNFPFMVWLKDEKSRFLAVNKTFSSTFHWPSPESMIGKCDMDITSPELAEKYRLDDQMVMSSGISMQTEELTGSLEPHHWVEVYKSPLIVDGAVAGTVGFARDITKRKKVEIELRTAKAEAEKANQAKSRFLAAASHDLRQPLSALSLYTDLLENSVPQDLLPIIGHITHCVDGLSELLTDLLDISKLEAGVVKPKLTNFSVDDLLNSLISVYAAKAGQKGLQLRWRPSGVFACCDHQLLRRILGNLISNAVRYTTRGGVLIACRIHEGKRWVEVWDTGIGIPADKVCSIFEEFTQLDEDGRGSGLGLAIVAKATTLLDIHLRMHSRPGRGSMFAVELPFGEAPQAAPPAPAPKYARPLRIALVDNNSELLNALTIALERLGHQIIAAPSGQSLMDKLGSTAPDILVSDYRLNAGENGFDVIQAAKRTFGEGLPAFIITGDTDPHIIRSMARRDIAVHYKPLSVDALLTLIAEAVARGHS